MEYGKHTGYEFQDVDIFVDVSYINNKGEKIEETFSGSIMGVFADLLKLQKNGIDFDCELTDCFL